MKCKNRLKGEAYIDAIVNTFIICVLVACSLAILPILYGQYMLSVEVHSIARDISITGECNYDTFTINGKSVTPEVKYGDDTTIKKNTYIQLGDEFEVSASVELSISVGGFVNIPMILTSNATGRSEKYWKDLALNLSS